MKTKKVIEIDDNLGKEVIEVDDNGSDVATPKSTAPNDIPAYILELAKSARSECRKCMQKISKSDLRVGVIHEGTWGLFTKWQHIHCTVFHPTVKEPAALDGFFELSAEMKEAVRQRVLESASEVDPDYVTLDPDEVVRTDWSEPREPSTDLLMPLLPYQKEGLGWMVHQEHSNAFGGILADEMGMGKTIQAIALLLDNRPLKASLEVAPVQTRINGSGSTAPATVKAQEKPRGRVRNGATKDKGFDATETSSSPQLLKSPYEVQLERWAASDDRHRDCLPDDVDPSSLTHGGTLIVLPTVAIRQWQAEIARFTSPGALTVRIYHGSGRTLSPGVLASTDVVLTSYKILESEYRKATAGTKVRCSVCGRNFYPEKLRVHRKYFCGESAQRTAAQSKTQKKKQRTNHGSKSTGAGADNDSEYDEDNDDEDEDDEDEIDRQKQLNKAKIDSTISYKKKPGPSSKSKSAKVTFYTADSDDEEDEIDRQKRENKEKAAAKSKLIKTTIKTSISAAKRQSNTKRRHKLSIDSDKDDSDFTDDDSDILTKKVGRARNSSGEKKQTLTATNSKIISENDSKANMCNHSSNSFISENVDNEENEDVKPTPTNSKGKPASTTYGKVSGSKSFGSRGTPVRTAAVAAMAASRKSKGKLAGGVSDDSEDDDFEPEESDENDDDDYYGSEYEHSDGRLDDCDDGVNENKAAGKRVQHKIEGNGSSKISKSKSKSKRVRKGSKSFDDVDQIDDDTALGFIENSDDSEVEREIEAALREARRSSGKKAKATSPMHQVSWFRVILDEAHLIKDRSTSTAKAVFNLVSVYKWCLTGTPLQNRVGELYSLVRFLRIDPHAYYYCSKKGCGCKSLHYRYSKGRCLECDHTPMSHFCHFNKHILNPIKRCGYIGDGRKAMLKLKEQVLDQILLRRTKTTRADDIQLPPRIVRVSAGTLDEKEEDFYQALYTQSQAQFNDYVQRGTVLNNYAHIFDILIRLRQAVDHPYLVIYSEKQIQAREDSLITTGSHDVTSSTTGVSTSHGFNFGDGAGVSLGAPSFISRPIAVSKSTAGSVKGKKKATVARDVDLTCPLCHEDIQDGVVGGCGHVFCRLCITDYVSTTAGNSALFTNADNDYGDSDDGTNKKRKKLTSQATSSSSSSSTSAQSSNNQNDGNTNGHAAKCPVCLLPLTIDANMASYNEIDAEEDDDVKSDNDTDFADNPNSPVGRLGDATSVWDESKRRSKSILRHVDLEHFQTSTKMEALMRELHLMSARDPGAKAIVFSQFVNMLDLLEYRIQLGGIACVKLMGNMTLEQRDSTIKRFQNDVSTQVLLISLKAGGVALNLTVASYIYLMDPWWNPAAEMQAIDRTHRIGQHKPIYATRFIIANTIEERILQLQQKKQLVFDGTIGGDAGSMARLTVDDMRFLFQ